MSLACHARLNSLATWTCRAAGVPDARAARIRWRAEEANWRQAPGVRPVIAAISAKA